jgi:SRSO17 transposase
LRPDRTPESERWLVLRNDANCKLTYALSNAPQETPMGELVRVSGARWPIERCFQENKLNDACGSLLTLGMSSSLTPRPP